MPNTLESPATTKAFLSIEESGVRHVHEALFVAADGWIDEAYASMDALAEAQRILEHAEPAEGEHFLSGFRGPVAGRWDKRPWYWIAKSNRQSMELLDVHVMTSPEWVMRHALAEALAAFINS